MNGPRMDIFYDKMGFSFSYDDIQEEIFPTKHLLIHCQKWERQNYV